jgi:hypothetical protein
MRRFESTPVVRIEAETGRGLAAWVAGRFALRLAGLAGLRALPPGRALLLPRCRAVHTAGMRIPIDVAFLTWPPAGGTCTVLALRHAVPPFRLVAGPRRVGVAALEAAGGTLAALGMAPAARLRLGPPLLPSRHGSGT